MKRFRVEIDDLDGDRIVEADGWTLQGGVLVFYVKNGDCYPQEIGAFSPSAWKSVIEDTA